MTKKRTNSPRVFRPELGEYIFTTTNSTTNDGYYEYIGPLYTFQLTGAAFLIKSYDEEYKSYQTLPSDQEHATHIRLFWNREQHQRTKDYDLSNINNSVTKLLKTLLTYTGIWLTPEATKDITPSIPQLVQLIRKLIKTDMHLGFFTYTNEETGNSYITFSLQKAPKIACDNF